MQLCTQLDRQLFGRSVLGLDSQRIVSEHKLHSMFISSTAVVPQSLLSDSTNIEEIQGPAVRTAASGENTKDSDNGVKENPTQARELKKQSSPTPDRLRRRENSAASKAFELFDVDGDGYINVSELGNLVQTISGKGLSKDLVAQIINQCDKDGNSKLSLQEFEEIFHRFNKESRAIHRKQTILIRENADLNVSVPTSTKCVHMCCAVTEIECCLYHKQLLLLASTIVLAAMVPLFGSVYQVRCCVMHVVLRLAIIYYVYL